MYINFKSQVRNNINIILIRNNIILSTFHMKINVTILFLKALKLDHMTGFYGSYF